LFTVTVGKANVAVAVTVNVGVTVAVKAVVGVKGSVAVNVTVGEEVSVHEAAVAVSDVAVSLASWSGDEVQAVANSTTSKIIFNFISSLLEDSCHGEEHEDQPSNLSIR
jgi:hypothetical protein